MAINFLISQNIDGGITTSSSSSMAGINMTSGIAMGTNAITGMADPSSAQDAATKAYVDTQISGVPQGTVTGVGAANRVAYWASSSQIQSDSGFTFSNTDDSITLGKVKVGNGTEALPSLTFNGDPDTGFYMPGAGQVSLSINGTEVFGFGTLGIGVFINSPLVPTATLSDSSTKAASTQFVKLQGYTTNTGTVTSVTGSSPISSTGGTTPEISIATANASTTGALSSTDWTTFNNKTSNTGTVISVGLSTGGDAFQITGTPVTTSGTLAISFQGDTEQYINGEGDLTTFPTIPSAANNSTITINTGTGLSGGGSFTLNQAGNTTFNLAATNNGTVFSVATSSPITGGTITSSGTIGFDSTAVTSLPNLVETGTVAEGVWNSNTKLTKPSNTDGSYQGELVYLGASTVVKGKLYVFSGGDWVSADADAENTTKGLLAMSVANGSSGTVGMLTRGMYTLSYDPGNEGDTLYVSTTAGNVTIEPPSGSGKFVRIVGTLIDGTNGQIFFNPDYTYLTLS